jgi:hypothetical protein
LWPRFPAERFLGALFSLQLKIFSGKSEGEWQGVVQKRITTAQMKVDRHADHIVV